MSNEEAFRRYQQGSTKRPESPLPVRGSSFEAELIRLINRNSMENESGTPDFILAQYLTGCLEVYNTTIMARANWRGERIDSIFDIKYEKKIPITVDGTQIGEAQATMYPTITSKYGRLNRLAPIFEVESETTTE